MSTFRFVSVLALVAALLLPAFGLPGYQAAGDDRRVEFDNPYPTPFSPRARPAALSRQGVPELLSKGYARIGTLEVQRVTERCVPKGEEYACRPVRHAGDATAEFLAEAAQRGGDLVVLERAQESGTEPYSKRGKCAAWGQTQQLVYDYQIHNMKLVSRPHCVQYETLEGRLTTSTTAGAVWRLDPEYAKAQQSNQTFLYAAALGRTDEVKKLIAQGLDLNTRNMEGDLVLGFAAMTGHREVVTALLDAGADINATDLRGTALHRAAANGRLEIVKLLIERKAEVNAKLPYGRHKGATPLLEAARTGSLAVVDYLLAHGATVDAATEAGVTPLMAASMEGNTDVIDALVAAGAEVTATSQPIPQLAAITGWNGGWTPLMLSIATGKHAAQMALIAHRNFIPFEAANLARRIDPASEDAAARRIFALGEKLSAAKHLYGYIDASGEFVIPPRFRNAQSFSEGLAGTCDYSQDNQNSCGFIDKSGAYVIPPKYFSTDSFSEGLGAVTVWYSKKNRETGAFHACGYVDKTGNAVIAPGFANCGKFSEGLAGVTVAGGKFGYIDKSGRWVISPKRKGSPGRFTGGYAQVWEQGLLKLKCKWIDRSGKEVSPTPEMVKRAEATKSKEFTVLSDLQPILSSTQHYSWTQDYPTRNAWAYADASGKIKIRGPFSLGYRFAEGLACVMVFAPEVMPLVHEWAELWAEVTRDRDLGRAVRNGDLESAARLLEAGADVNARDARGMTPLMFAAANGRTRVAKLLLDKGADVQAQDERGYTALMLVAGSGNVELAQLLLQSGSDVQARNDLGLTVAEIAELLDDSKIGDVLPAR